MGTYFLSPPLKKSSEVDLIHPLRNFISSSYSSVDHPEDYSKQLQELQKLRDYATNRVYEKHENSLEHLYRYYDQLCALEAKFPLTENQVRISFKWKDAFDKGTLFTGKLSLTLCSGAYERCCILFNMAALQAQIADVQNVDSDDGLKVAAKYFQQSAGILTYLKDNVLSLVPQELTPDLCPDTLAALAQLMLAQAQESVCKKAIRDQMKDVIVAKVSMQTCEYYAESLKLLQQPNVRSYWDKDWVPKVAGKQALYHGLAEYYQAKVADAKKIVGETIARLSKADELVKTAQSRAGDLLTFAESQGRIERELAQARKDNDFIYHEKIPEYRSLAAVGKAALAKASDMPKVFSSKFTDLFDQLVPIHVQQALGVFEARKTELVNGEIAKLRESTQLMNSCLASLNLPAAIEDFSSHRLPASLTEKSKAVRDKGGVTAIERMMREMPDLLQRNQEILDEADRMLKEEQDSDSKLREELKEKWNRTPSNTLTEPLRQESGKYRQILQNAINADSVVREKFNSHKANIILLSKSENELLQAIPAANPTSALKDSPVVKQLRGYMEEVETIKAERDAVESELKDAKNNIQSQLLAALAKSGVIQEESLSVEELGRVYGPIQKLIRESVARQEQLLAKVQEANTEFCKAKSDGGSAVQREQMLKDLASAHDMFVELKANIEEGMKFYNDLTPLLLKFQSKCSDWCFARKTEKEELLKDIQNTISRQPAAAPPQEPQHYTPSVTTHSEPPPRPPPPQTTATSSATAPAAPPAPYPSQQPYPYQPMPIPGMPAYNPYVQATPPPMPPGYNPYAQQFPPAGFQGGYPQQAPQAGGYPGQAPQAGGYPGQAPQTGGYPQQQQPPAGYPGYPYQQPPYPQQQWRG